VSVFSVRGLHVRYGPTLVVNDLDLDVDAGQIVGLIGPNGAGKTTTVDALTGFVPASGRIILDGRDISGLPAHRRARLGLGRTWQSLELFDDLTVRDNLRIAADHDTLLGAVRRRRRTAAGSGDPAAGALEVFGLADLAERFPHELSQGQRKLVTAARALAGAPRIVCMDEPAAGLDTDESRALGERLRALAATGLGILLIDHDMGLVLEVCDQVVVIDFGVTIASGPPAAIRTDPAVIEAYLGNAARAEP